MCLLVLLNDYARPMHVKRGQLIASSRKEPCLVQIIEGAAMVRLSSSGAGLGIAQTDDWVLCPAGALAVDVEALERTTTVRVMPLERAKAVWPAVQRQGVAVELETLVEGLHSELLERLLTMFEVARSAKSGETRVREVLERFGTMRSGWVFALAGLTREVTSKHLNALHRRGEVTKVGPNTFALAR